VKSSPPLLRHGDDRPGDCLVFSWTEDAGEKPFDISHLFQ
jgi:hypothetical protein